MTKVLFVGGGRRVSLAERFFQNGCSVVAYESSSDVPIRQVATVVKGLSFKDRNVSEDILRTVESYSIDLIVPLHDLAFEAFQLDNTTVKWSSRLYEKLAMSPNNVCEICSNKRMFECWMKENFNSFYPSTNKEKLLPIIIKPKFGFGSNNISIIYTMGDFQNWISNHTDCMSDEWIMQSYIPGDEYTVDAYFTMGLGKCVGAVPRLRERVAGGEVVDATIVHRQDLIEITKKIGEKLGLRGPVCFQYRVTNNEDKFLFEINPRFGGGSIMSIDNGFDMVNILLYEFGCTNNLKPYKRPSWGTKMRRVFREIYINDK